MNWIIPNGIGVASLLDLVVSRPVNSLLGGLSSASLASSGGSGGTSYSVGDVLSVTGGTLLPGATAATLIVTAIDGGGAITAFNVLSYGGWQMNPQTPNNVTGGTGHGASINLIFAAPINRADKCVAMAVQKIRGAIYKGNRTPLSLTAGSIPPELEADCYALALELLLPSNPALAQYAINPPGSGKSAMSTMIDKANQMLLDLKKGEPVEYPNDPKLVDDSGFLAADSGTAATIVGDVDLSTDFNATTPYVPPLGIGNARYSGVVVPNGVQIGNISDQYLLYTSGVLASVYVKGGTSGTNTGWVIATL